MMSISLFVNLYFHCHRCDIFIFTVNWKYWCKTDMQNIPLKQYQSHFIWIMLNVELSLSSFIIIYDKPIYYYVINYFIGRTKTFNSILNLIWLLNSEMNFRLRMMVNLLNYFIISVISLFYHTIEIWNIPFYFFRVNHITF